ncbi:hypothetical protein [Moraxella lacunata]|uniref:hypothetical protein n=1 Tax=Moraxella lacunata TaxID=477 RepID=UPI003EE23C51
MFVVCQFVIKIWVIIKIWAVIKRWVVPCTVFRAVLGTVRSDGVMRQMSRLGLNDGGGRMGSLGVIGVGNKSQTVISCIGLYLCPCDCLNGGRRGRMAHHAVGAWACDVIRCHKTLGVT